MGPGDEADADLEGEVGRELTDNKWGVEGKGKAEGSNDEGEKRMRGHEERLGMVQLLSEPVRNLLESVEKRRPQETEEVTTGIKRGPGSHSRGSSKLTPQSQLSLKGPHTEPQELGQDQSSAKFSDAHTARSEPRPPKSKRTARSPRSPRSPRSNRTGSNSLPPFTSATPFPSDDDRTRTNNDDGGGADLHSLALREATAIGVLTGFNENMNRFVRRVKAMLTVLGIDSSDLGLDEDLAYQVPACSELTVACRACASLHSCVIDWMWVSMNTHCKCRVV